MEIAFGQGSRRLFRHSFWIATGVADSLPGFFRKMREQVQIGSSHHGSHSVHLPTSLKTAVQVYVRHDTVRRPLQRPYDGPFEVLRRGDKTFDIRRQDCTVTVSVDILKPAFTSSLPLPPSPLLPSSVRAKPTVRLLPVSPSTVWAPPPSLSDTDFPPLPPSEPYKTRAGRSSVPPDRFSC